MILAVAALTATFVILLPGSSGFAAAQGPRRSAIVWMGLEITGENVSADMQSLAAHRTDLTGVSFEHYILVSTGNMREILLLSNVTSGIESLGLQTFPMVITTSLANIEQLIAHPSNFIHEAVSAAVGAGYTGYNIDFEPSQTANNSVAVSYALFLTNLADALHNAGKKLTVDIASWNPFWNFSALANTTVDTLYDMNTYASPFFNFGYALDSDLAVISPPRLGVGLITVNVNNGTLLQSNSVNERFLALEKDGVTSIAVWDMPLASYWWHDLSDFVGIGAPSNVDIVYGAGISAAIAITAVAVYWVRTRRARK